MLIDSRHRAYIVLLLLVVLVTAGSLKNSFLFMDDYYYIVNNPKIDVSLLEVPSLFSRPLGKISDVADDNLGKAFAFYRPALSLLYSLNYKIWGLNPVGFHITNILFHLLSAIFVFRVGLLLFDENILISLIAAALFAVHPVHNEVLGRVAMNENIYGFFVITTFYLFLSDKKYLSVFAFATALLSKESAAMLPFVLCLLAINKDGFKKGIFSMIPFALVLSIYSLVRIIVVGFLIGGDGIPFHVKQLNIATALTDYLKLLIIPYPLSPFYPSRIFTSFSHPHVLTSLATFFIVAYIAFKTRKDKVLLNLLISTVIMLVPVILLANSLRLGFDDAYIAERQLYVPSMFFSLFVSGFILKNSGEEVRKYAVAGFIGIIMLFSVNLILTCRIWENDLTIKEKFLRDCPDIRISYTYRGEILFAQGKLDAAMNEFRAAFYPNSAYLNFLKQFEKDTSFKLYVNNKRINLSEWGNMREYIPIFAELHFHIGRVYFEKNDLENAIRKFKVAVILEPHFAMARSYLAMAYLKTCQFDKAKHEYGVILNDISNNRIYWH